MYVAEVEGALSLAVQSGQRGVCTGCKGEVVSKCGEFTRWHWAHMSTPECDQWGQGISLWHLTWSAQVPVERREIVSGNHRADAVTPDGLVVEFQHSPIDPAQVGAREAHWGPRGLWVVDMSGRASGRPPAWTGRARWRVLLDYGDGTLRWGRQSMPRADFVTRLNTDRPAADVTHDWRDRKHWARNVARCVICSGGTHLLNDQGLPSCKVCVEAVSWLGF